MPEQGAVGQRNGLGALMRGIGLALAVVMALPACGSQAGNGGGGSGAARLPGTQAPSDALPSGAPSSSTAAGSPVASTSGAGNSPGEAPVALRHPDSGEYRIRETTTFVASDPERSAEPSRRELTFQVFRADRRGEVYFQTQSVRPASSNDASSTMIEYSWTAEAWSMTAVKVGEGDWCRLRVPAVVLMGPLALSRSWTVRERDPCEDGTPGFQPSPRGPDGPVTVEVIRRENVRFRGKNRDCFVIRSTFSGRNTAGGEMTKVSLRWFAPRLGLMLRWSDEYRLREGVGTIYSVLL